MSTKPFSRLAFTMVRLHALVADGNQTKLKFEASFDKDPVYACEWLQNTPRALIAGNWATTVIDKCHDKPDEEQLVVIRNVIKELVGRIERWSPQYGSSPYHNAVDGERFLAMRDVRDTLMMAFEPEEETNGKSH